MGLYENVLSYECMYHFTEQVDFKVFRNKLWPQRVDTVLLYCYTINNDYSYMV